MKVCSKEVFGPSSPSPRTTISTTRSPRQRLGFRVAGRHLHGRHQQGLRAIHTLDYGGVLVNEVPDVACDQQPYGGLRDSGNTREGPAYSVKEMTEIKMVVLGG
jgi:acyl-CoA reductase-like NAD-dependent aldehyde dehydrogenase